MSGKKKIVIIGGGIAGLEAAAGFANTDYQVTVLEKDNQLFGKLNQWHHLFPNFRSSDEVKNYLKEDLKNGKVSIVTNSEVVAITNNQHAYQITSGDNKKMEADAIIFATGFKLFDASRKEEYGYKIYENVITSADLEKLMRSGKNLKTSTGKNPERIAFIHCVGSRDKKSGNHYCSRVCCITGVKQAIEIRKLIPESRIYNFYMDLRMYGHNFEELYIEAQQKWGINFIRGRVSEIAENIDYTLQLKAEDTLVGRPIKMNFDLVVLLIGMEPCSETAAIAKSAGLKLSPGNFLSSTDAHIKSNETDIPGIFITGTCREPMSIQETVTDARATSLKVISYLKNI